MEIFSVKIFLPLFYVRYREAWGVRLSSRLPPPRTILGALAKGLGIILGIEGGETLINGEPARKILTEAVESSSYGFVRPLSPLVKTSQILRVVPAIEQDKVSFSVIADLKNDFIRKVSGFHDAFKHDVIFSNEMELIYVISLKQLNESLTKHGYKEIKLEEITSALKMIDRIGPTEALGGVLSIKHVKQPKEVSSPATINTYVPFEEPNKWVEPLYEASQEYLIEPLYPSLRFIGKQKVTNETRKIKINFLLPLSYRKRRGGREIFQPSNVLVRPMENYCIYSIDGEDDATRIILPEGELDR